MACVPAYDRYFIDGLKTHKIPTSFNRNSINALLELVEKHKSELIKLQQQIKEQTNKHYPLMKLVDMYFWQIGFDKEVATKAKYETSTN